MEKYNIPEQNSLDSMEGIEEIKVPESISNLTSVRCYNVMYGYGATMEDAMGYAWNNNLKLIPKDDTVAIEEVRNFSKNSDDVVFALIETDEPWEVDFRYGNYGFSGDKPKEVKGYNRIAFFQGEEGYGDWESSGSGHQTFFFCKKNDELEINNTDHEVMN